MSMSFDIEKAARWALTFAAMVFSVFLFLEARFWLRSEAEMEATALKERILMSESTRYAEIAKYYTDKLKNGEELTEAETARLDLVQQQQLRINETLSKDD